MTDEGHVYTQIEYKLTNAGTTEKSTQFEVEMCYYYYSARALTINRLKRLHNFNNFFSFFSF